MRSEPSDHYATLGIPATATPTQITHAYRTLARSLHPDTTTIPGDTRAPFTAVTTAYRILHDPARRAAYDRSRRTPPAAQAPLETSIAVHVNVTTPRPRDVTATTARTHPTAPEPLLRVGPVRISPLP